MTQIGRFRTVTPVWIHRWLWNVAQILKQQRRDALFFFQGHPSNFKVTWDKTSPILTQIGRFRTIGRSQLSNPSDLPCFSLFSHLLLTLHMPKLAHEGKVLDLYCGFQLYLVLLSLADRKSQLKKTTTNYEAWNNFWRAVKSVYFFYHSFRKLHCIHMPHINCLFHENQGAVSV